MYSDCHLFYANKYVITSTDFAIKKCHFQFEKSDKFFSSPLSN